MNACSIVVALSLLALAACDRPPTAVTPGTPIPEPVAKTSTLETSRLADEIDRFDREPTPLHAASVKKALAALDGEIAELQERVAKTSGNDRAEAASKLRNLESYRATQAARFSAMQAKSPVGASPAADSRSGADKAEDSARAAAARVEEGAKKAGNAVGNALERAGSALKDATK